MLTEAVRRRPYQVVLLDEFEKAHREVSNLLLQVFDEGHLTDSHGRKVDFRNTIIIMTSCDPGPTAALRTRVPSPDPPSLALLAHSNLGSDVLSSMPETVPPGDPGVREQIMEHVRAHFSPEFINRIDEAIVFDRLRREHMSGIADIQVRAAAGLTPLCGANSDPWTPVRWATCRQLKEVQRQLDDRKVVLNVPDETKQWLTECVGPPLLEAGHAVHAGWAAGCLDADASVRAESASTPATVLAR